MIRIKIRYSEKGFTLVELLLSLAILGVVVFALTAILHTASQSNQTVMTDINQIKQARKAIDTIMDEIHYSRAITSFTSRTITYIDSNNIANTVLSYNPVTRILTVTRGAAGTPVPIVSGNILREFTIERATFDPNTYNFTMTFRYNPNDVTKDLNVTTTVKPFTY